MTDGARVLAYTRRSRRHCRLSRETARSHGSLCIDGRAALRGGGGREGGGGEVRRHAGFGWGFSRPMRRGAGDAQRVMWTCCARACVAIVPGTRPGVPARSPGYIVCPGWRCPSMPKGGTSFGGRVGSRARHCPGRNSEERERGSRRCRITRGIPCINHDATRPARLQRTSPNHAVITVSHAHTKLSLPAVWGRRPRGTTSTHVNIAEFRRRIIPQSRETVGSSKPEMKRRTGAL